jgi:hypothetical protein
MTRFVALGAVAVVFAVLAPSFSPTSPPRGGFHTAGWAAQCELSGLGWLACWLTEAKFYAQMNPDGRVWNRGFGDESTKGMRSPFADHLLPTGKTWQKVGSSDAAGLPASPAGIATDTAGGSGAMGANASCESLSAAHWPRTIAPGSSSASR